MEKAFRYGVVAMAAAVLALMAAYGSAKATDLGAQPYKDEIQTGPAVAWTGAYIGFGLGVGSARSELGLAIKDGDDTLAAGNGASLTGFAGVLTAGADWKFPSSRWLIGVYGEYDLGRREGDVLTIDVNNTRELSLQTELSGQWAVGGRVGVLVTPGSLVYAKLGYTQADLDLALTPDLFDTGVLSKVKGGVTVGGGVELSLGSGFFARGEYMYSNYGKVDLYDVAPVKVTSDLDDHRVTAGIIYKIGMGR